jgi:hypothetical protein
MSHTTSLKAFITRKVLMQNRMGNKEELVREIISYNYNC